MCAVVTIAQNPVNIWGEDWIVGSGKVIVPRWMTKALNLDSTSSRYWSTTQNGAIPSNQISESFHAICTFYMFVIM
jgi:hypothetical protein